MIINRELRPTARFEILSELPTSDRPFYLPVGGTAGGRDGIIVRFGGEDRRWTGVFAFGEHGGSCPRSVCALPDEDEVLVVSDGDGFIVNENVPGKFRNVKTVPVRHVLVITRKDMVVLADDTSLVAYGRGGVRWATERIGWSELRIERVTDRDIHCTTFDIRSDEDKHFTVDLETGKCLGGIEVV